MMERIKISTQASDVEKNAARLLGRELEVLGVRTADAPVVVMGTPESVPEIRKKLARQLQDLGPEGFIIVPSEGTLTIAASQPLGVLYGVGRALRESLFENGRWQLPDGEIRDRPHFPVRSIYFAGHMGNWYSHASLDELKEYADQMVLWGYNELTTILEVRPGENFYDAWARLGALEDHARSLGMKVGRIAQSNTSFDKPPEEFRATPGPIPGSYDVCPIQKPGAREFLIQDKKTFFDIMQPFDFMTLWPYDGGGCYGEECRPWAATFLRLSKDIAEWAVGDKGEVRVSAWFFERDTAGEDDALFEYLEEKPDWFRHIVAGSVEASRWKRDGRILPDRYRVLLFPEISMFDGIPWGGRGANPAARKFANELADVREMLDGAVVYSEGRYEDVNKILLAQLLWDPDRDPVQIMRDYSRFYLTHSVEQQVADLISEIEEGMEGLPDSERWRRGKFYSHWDAAAAEIEDRLSGYARDSWRWQLLRAKTRLESLHAALRDGDVQAEDEMRRIYDHLQAQLNRHDPERSLATWIYAPMEEAFPRQP